MDPLKELKRLCLGVLFTAFALVIGAKPLLGGTVGKATHASSTETHDLSKYVGADTCKGCHEDVFKQFEATPHWKTLLDTRKGKEWQGCEACHGPGADHVNAGGGKGVSIFSFRDVSTEEISKRCMGCHEYSEEEGNFSRSVHKVNNVSCIDCHSPHHAKGRQFLLVNSQPQLCYACHLEAKLDFSKPFRHRVNEGLVKCTDCHNEHGGYLSKQLRSAAAQDAVCFKCHVDKAGPFVFEHQPVKTEGCTACHVPHGGSNPRRLKRSQVNLLCLECHTVTSNSGVPGIPSFHNQAQKYQSCTLCHVMIHGSNFDSFFFK
jgi:DmsE family decaheme c-type cytochrome